MATRKNPTTRRAAPADNLSQAVNESGLIQAGAHPEFEQPTPLEHLIAGTKQIIKTAADKARSVLRTSDQPKDLPGQGIQGNRHGASIKSGSGMGIK
jgi:hypothetical protein